MISRRKFLKWTATLGALGAAGGSYAFFFEPMMRLGIAQYRLRPQQWPASLKLTIAALADIHACRPWMDPARIRSIVQRTNDLGADMIVLLGDYVAGHRFVTDYVHSAEWSEALAGLKAPLGVHAILGNHEFWEDKTVQRAGEGSPFGRRALEAVGIPVYENDVARLSKDGQSFWLAGLGDQLAFLPSHRRLRRPMGADDLLGTLAKVTDNRPVILMAHEPDIALKVPYRVSLLLSGHTHGGQVRLMGWSPVVPSRFGNRFAYGHMQERCDIVVSSGLGCAIAPIRFGVPPEIVHITLGGEGVAEG